MKGENGALQKDASKFGGDDNVLYLDGCTHLSKLTKLFILNECGFLYVNCLDKVENTQAICEEEERWM